MVTFSLGECWTSRWLLFRMFVLLLMMLWFMNFFFNFFLALLQSKWTHFRLNRTLTEREYIFFFLVNPFANHAKPIWMITVVVIFCFSKLNYKYFLSFHHSCFDFQCNVTLVFLKWNFWVKRFMRKANRPRSKCFWSTLVWLFVLKTMRISPVALVLFSFCKNVFISSFLPFFLPFLHSLLSFFAFVLSFVFCLVLLNRKQNHSCLAWSFVRRLFFCSFALFAYKHTYKNSMSSSTIVCVNQKRDTSRTVGSGPSLDAHQINKPQTWFLCWVRPFFLPQITRLLVGCLFELVILSQNHCKLFISTLFENIFT